MAIPEFDIGPVNSYLIFGFLVGFIVAWIIFGIRILVLKSRGRKDIGELRKNLVSRIDLETTALNNLKKEIEDLKKKNANLKTSMQNLSGKPGRLEKLQLKIYQSAIEKMSVRAPGFAPAWHIVLQECEEETGKSLDGAVVFKRRIVPAVGTGWADNSNQLQDPQSRGGSHGINSDSELSGLSSSVKVKKPSLFSRLRGR